MANTDYRQTIRTLSDSIVAAQAPIRILDAIKWDDRVQQAFFESNCRVPPPVTADYYNRVPLNFIADDLRLRFKAIIHDILTQLGKDDAAASIMLRMCNEYLRVLDLLENRGKKAFTGISQELYGRSTDCFHAGGPHLASLSNLLDDSLRNIDDRMFLEQEPKTIPTREAIIILQERMNLIFNDPDCRVKVIESDGIVADAAAGSDYIKLRKDAFFSERDLHVLEAHEGWVHVGTTLNGRMQPVCSFLSKGTPSDTVTQEGLAVFIEVISFKSHPSRLRRIVDRIRAIHLAEQGANFMDIFNMLVEDGRSEQDAYVSAMRVFRGSTPDGGPFTKDLSYSKGFVQVYNFIRLAVRRGRIDMIPLMFCGKLAIEDLGTLSHLMDTGMLTCPRFLPPPLEDLNALTAWMAYSNFLNRLDLVQIEADLAPLFAY